MEMYRNEYNEDSILDQSFRASFIAATKTEENNDRKEKSLQDTEVYSGQIHDYVYERFVEKGYKESTLSTIPIVSEINISKKVVDSQAGVYKTPPKRTFSNVSEDQEEKLNKIYEDAWFDAKMLGSNRLFKLQQQTHVLVEPVNGQIKLRNLKQHHIDVLPDYVDPEKALAYVISSYDKHLSELNDSADKGDGFNQIIADDDDYKLKERYIWWSKNYHFVTDGWGQLLSDEVESPIAGTMPIVEISEDKDYEYFIQDRNLSTQFTVSYNEALSNNGHIVHMQGFAQAYLKAPQELMPTSVTIGPTKLLKLITDPDAPNGDVEFGFASPSSDLGGAKDYTDSLLSQFLSSMGLDPSSITSNDTNQQYQSGTDRLLAMIENFDATRTDFSRYEYSEKKIFKVIAEWVNALAGSKDLMEEYKMPKISDKASVSVEFNRPEAVKSDGDKIEEIERMIDLGLIDKTEAAMRLFNMERTEAEEYLNGLEETQIN